MAIPKGFTADLIGKVVTVNVFLREGSGSDELKSDSMAKHVGTLQAYYHDKNGFVFQLVGCTPVGATHTGHYVEVHPYQVKYLVG